MKGGDNMNFYKITYVDVQWPGHNKVFFTDNYGRAKQLYDERAKELKAYGYKIEKENINLESKRLQEA